MIRIKWHILLPLLIVWLITSAVLVDRLQSQGAYASLSMRNVLQFVAAVGHAHPETIRLNQSYTQWALALNCLDPSNFIRAGLGLAEGEGVSIRNISPGDPDNQTYIPYYFQAPGAPIVIGTFIRLFGERCVLPYCIFIFVVHFLTALLTCVLASRYFEDDRYVLGAGVLSLLCLPVLDFNFGTGLFASEPLVAPFVVCALIALSNFSETIRDNSCTYRASCFAALGFGVSLGMAAYFRDIYSTFAQFCLLVMFLTGCLKRSNFRHFLVFVLISFITLSAIEHPWKKRNQRDFGEYSMTGSTYYGYAMWDTIWNDYKEKAQWGCAEGLGLGYYLAPKKSKDVLAKLNNNKQDGSIYAFQSLVSAVCKRPWDAIRFKLKDYDHLWFGHRVNWFIYCWCLFSMLIFFAFLYLTRSQFIPELWLHPLFLFLISPLIMYEHRFAQPFFFFVTPITTMYVLQYFLAKLSLSKKVKSASVAAET